MLLEVSPAVRQENYPPTLKHSSGKTLTLEPNRRLLAFRLDQSKGQQLDFDKKSEAKGLTRERVFIERQRKRPRFNDTPQRIWFRTVTGKPIEENVQAIGFLKDLSRPVEEVEPTEALRWTGPVYRFPGSRDDRGLVCALPHVLLIRPAAGIRPEDLDNALEQLQLDHVPEKSRYLIGYRYYIVRNPLRQTVYPIQKLLEDKNKKYQKLVRSVQFDFVPLIKPTATGLTFPFHPADPLYKDGSQAHLESIKTKDGWNVSNPPSTGNGVVVAVIDSGCDLYHPDLAGAFFIDPSGSEPGARFQDDIPITTGGGPLVADEDHGTKCAGILAARYNDIGIAGLAGNCRLMPLNAVQYATSAVANAIQYAAQHGARVLSMSFSGHISTADSSTDDYFEGPEGADGPVELAIEDAFINHNVVMCAATDNQNANRLYLPASHPYVIACGATTTDGSDVRWEDSNHGENMSVVAPGVGIPTTIISGTPRGDYGHGFTGTSFATPHVAALAALLIGKYPTLTNVQVCNIIERTAEKVNASPTPVSGKYVYEERTETESVGNMRFPKDTLRYPNGTWNEQVGYGRINVHHALDFADVLIKDWAGDTGVEPSTPPEGDFWSSSDIVIRPSNDAVFLPDDPFESRKVVRGQDNFIYVQVTNNGPNVAENVRVNVRVVPYVGTEFAYPADWTTIDANHAAPIPEPDTAAQFDNIPAGGTVRAKFRITSAQVATLWGGTTGTILAEVNAQKDYAFVNALTTGERVIIRRNNFALSNLSVVEVDAGSSLIFPFVVGSVFNMEQTVKILIAIQRLPDVFPSLPELPRPRPLPRIGLSLDDIPEPLASLESRAKVGGVHVDSGILISRGEARFVEIDAERATITLEREPKQLHALALQTVMPPDAKAGQQYVLNVSQKNAKGITVGGATIIYVVREQE